MSRRPGGKALPEHFDDRYMEWANGSFHLDGTPAETCRRFRGINLTDDRPHHGVPVRIAFPGA